LADFDYYLCASEPLRRQFEQFAERQELPPQQFLLETI